MNAVSGIAPVASSSRWASSAALESASSVAAPKKTESTVKTDSHLHSKTVAATAETAKAAQVTSAAPPSVPASTAVSTEAKPVSVAAAATQKDLPLGLLQSVSKPDTKNGQATLDYQTLRLALESGNMTAAQQAYLRLQNDLSLPQFAASA